MVARKGPTDQCPQVYSSPNCTTESRSTSTRAPSGPARRRTRR